MNLCIQKQQAASSNQNRPQIYGGQVLFAHPGSTICIQAALETHAWLPATEQSDGRWVATTMLRAETKINCNLPSKPFPGNLQLTAEIQNMQILLVKFCLGGETDFCCFQLHHLPKSSNFNVSKLLSLRYITL